MERLGDKTIVITGASSGIGRALALELAAPGCEIWLVGRGKERLESVAAQVRAKGAVPHVAIVDLSDICQSGRFLDENFPRNKRVDEIYLGAAITLFGEVKDTLPDDWEQIYHTNLLSPIQWAHYFYSSMVEQKAGKMVIISSLAAYAGYPTATAYATMKAGLLGLFRSLYYEGKSHGIQIHLISPGYVDTGIYQSAVFRQTSYEKTMEQIESIGLPIISAGKAATLIMNAVRRGEKEFAFPAYAAAMKWVAPRMPFLIGFIHRRIINGFRKNS